MAGPGAPWRLGLAVAVVLLALAALGLVLVRLDPGVLENRQTAIRLAYLAGFLVLVGPAVFMSGLGRNLRHLLVWAALMVALIAGHAVWQDGRLDRASLESAIAPRHDSADARGVARFRAGPGGGFVARGRVEGVPVTFLIDTGASDVVLTRADAERIGLKPESLDYTRPYATANGTVYGAPVRLDRVTVGGVTVNDVPASVAKSDMEHSLLGLSFLSRLRGYSVRNGVLTMEQ